MENIELKAVAREVTGKGASKRARKEGQIPAVVYKGGAEAVTLNVGTKELWHVLHTDAGENVIINLAIEGGNKSGSKTVIVKEVQHDPIKDSIIHVDFQEISLKEKLKVNVPVNIKGEAVGVKEEDGILNQVEWELEVECLPTEIPEHIDINVDELHINDAIHIKDISLKGDVRVLGDPEQVVVIISPPTSEEEIEGEEGEEEGGEEPELIKKGKKEEEGEAGESEESES